jgi:hypothetical protein
MWLGFCGGFTISLAIYGLFSSVVPEREFWKQVRSYFAGCGQFMQGLKGSAPGSPAATAIINSSVARWQGTLKQLQAQSGSINFKRVPGNDRQQTQALIESIEYLSLRFASAVQVREQSAGREVKLQDSVLLFMSATAQLRSLVGAIHDCRDKANALDWAAWNRNYF